MKNKKFKEKNKDLFEICICEHTRSMHKRLQEFREYKGFNSTYNDTIDKKCNADGCSCEKFILKN
jgi:hypothetical protein